MKRTQSVVRMLAALSIGLSLSVGWSATGGAATWPKNEAGRLVVRTHNSLAFNVLVTRANLHGGEIVAKTYLGKYGYALAFIGIYQYPVATVDNGSQWRIAGRYFNLDDTSVFGAGGTASNVVMPSRTIVVAYRSRDIVTPSSAIYVTADSGRRWYEATMPGAVQNVKYVLGGSGPNNSVLKSLVVSVNSLKPSVGNRTYRSLNEGRSWLLI